MKDDWIPTRIALPEVGDPVLVFIPISTKQKVACLCKDGSWQSSGHKIVQPVSHWQPCPPNPKEAVNG